MKEYAETYILSAQFLFDFVPLAICIGDDPYLERDFTEGAQILSMYQKMRSKVHNNFISRAVVEKIVDRIPFTKKHTHVDVRRLKANEFKLKGRHETQSESSTLFTQIMNGYKN